MTNILFFLKIAYQAHCFEVSIVKIGSQTKKTSTTRSGSVLIPAQKSRGNSVLEVVFSQTMPKMDFHYFHRLCSKERTC